MPEDFQFNVFLSRSAKDNSVLRPMAERSRVLACPAVASERRRRHCISANALGSDWTQLESGAFRFRDLINKEHRFLPLWRDDATTNESDWFRNDYEVRWQFANPTQTLATLLPKLPGGELSASELQG